MSGAKGLTGKARSESGQATVEFALTLILLMSFVLFHVQTSLGMAWANYVQYATFMSARAYLSAGPDKADQVRRAETVAFRMLKRPGSPAQDRFKSISTGVDGDHDEAKGLSIGNGDRWQEGEKDFSWLEGVRYRFRAKMFLLPLMGSSGGNAPENQLTLQSESWLGREPTFKECRDYLEGIIPDGRKAIDDNGC